ncbi:MAG: hypothetical protein ACREGH_00200 [Minisyncoccia bacterium]
MAKLTPLAICYIVAMIVIIVGVDVLFFRERAWTWERLIANIGIILVFAAFYFRIFK